MAKKSNQNATSSAPAWMVTFADLMALMLTFFVLLYSFSKIDEEKYKSIVQSLAVGFDGVQWIKRQFAQDELAGPEPGVIAPPVASIVRESHDENNDTNDNKTDSLYSQLNDSLSGEIAAGMMYLEDLDGKVVIRLPEKVTFSSGSDELSQQYIPVIHQIAALLKGVKGQIVIAGHTDDRPIATEYFTSNWALSAARAVSVAHHVLESGVVDGRHVIVAGYADTRPLVPNSSASRRAQNRRVEITILRDAERMP